MVREKEEVGGKVWKRSEFSGGDHHEITGLKPDVCPFNKKFLSYGELDEWMLRYDEEEDGGE